MMIKYTLALIVWMQSLVLLAQVPIRFESFNLPAESYWNGSDLSGGFSEADIFFPTLYDTSFGGFWAGGFALSNQTDSLTSGWGNQYASRAGSGARGSSTYAVAYDNGSFYSTIHPQLLHFDSVYITNNSFAYYSMLNGDAFSKKFGGLDGTDPDYFRVVFRGFFEGDPTGTPDTVYLADYRSDNPAEDYILKSWTLFDLSALGFCDSVTYTFESTDVGDFGINTPLYFCMDYLVATSIVIGTSNISTRHVQVFPNPSNGTFRIAGLDDVVCVRVFDVQGRCLASQYNANSFSFDHLPPGLVMLQITDERGNTHYLRHIIVP